MMNLFDYGLTPTRPHIYDDLWDRLESLSDH